MSLMMSQGHAKIAVTAQKHAGKTMRICRDDRPSLLLTFQGTWVQFPALTTSVTPVQGDPSPPLGLPGESSANMVHGNAGRPNTHTLKIIIFN